MKDSIPNIGDCSCFRDKYHHYIRSIALNYIVGYRCKKKGELVFLLYTIIHHTRVWVRLGWVCVGGDVMFGGGCVRACLVLPP